MNQIYVEKFKISILKGEWSKQMNSHLKNFYPEDYLNDSVNKSANNNDSLNNNNNNSTNGNFSTPQHSNDSTEYDKKIYVLNKKLRSYEKRRQKLLYESKREQDTTANNNQSQLGVESLSKDENSANVNIANSLSNEILSDSTSSHNAHLTNTNAQITPTSVNTISASQSLNVNKPLNQFNFNRNGSFIANFNAFGKSTLNADDAGHSKAGVQNCDVDKTSFYLNQETIGSNVKFPHLSNAASATNDANEILNEESNMNQMNPILNNNKSYPSMDRSMVLH